MGDHIMEPAVEYAFSAAGFAQIGETANPCMLRKKNGDNHLCSMV